jgi:hypothetical protein
VNEEMQERKEIKERGREGRSGRGCQWPALWSRVVFPTETKGVPLVSVGNTTRD